MSTLPYLADTPALLPYTLGQTATVTAHGPGLDVPLTLEVQDGSALSWDEATAPRCVLTVYARVPEDQAVLDALDPRNGITLSVTAGYVRPDGTADAHLIAQLKLRERNVSRPSNILTLTASGQEGDVLEAASPAVTLTPDDHDATVCVEAIVTNALGHAPVYASTLPPAPAYDVTAGEHVVIEPGQAFWDTVDDVLDRVDGDAYDNGLGVWVLQPRPALATTPAHHMAVGQGGTVLSADTALSRSGWYNAVQLVYSWETTENVYVGNDSSGNREYEPRQIPHRVVGRAAVTAGAGNVTDAGRVVYAEQRDVATSQRDADAAASAILARKISLGRTLALDGIAAWWLRPGHTITAQLPSGPRETHLATRVSFDLAAGRMSVGTRRPDTDPTITQGA